MVRTQIWSSGGGVQSTAIAVLIVTGRLPKPDLAVISDTERELSTTWAYMDKYTAPTLRAVGVELHRVAKSRYATVDLYGGKQGESLLIPAFTSKGDNIGKLPGYCSNEWKARVIHRWASAEHNVKAATLWIGISVDEQRRASQPIGKWEKRYPLIELNMTRQDCIDLVRNYGWPEPPRSSCYMCPNHRESEWAWQKTNAPEDHAKAIEFDAAMRLVDRDAWLHPSAVQLGEVEFSESNDVMFGHCQTGLCFV